MSEDTIQERLDAVQQLMRLFMAERIAYLIVAVISVGMLLFCGVQMIVEDTAPYSSLAGLFGSGGLISLGMGRLLTMWTQALRVVAGQDLGS